jgi:steroid 5-alpha-reductase/3-oxo-5-alpha-steroid 4-dehydrogenase 1
MEAPSSLGFALIYFSGADAFEIAPLVLFLMWQAHYFQRSFIYPFIRAVRPGDTTPLLVPVLAFTTNLGITYLNASILSWSLVDGRYPDEWLSDPRFIVGAMIFVAGYHINRKADRMLAALRKPGETGYRIPRGWLYERISCPNYFGEFLVWIGWAIATWSAAGGVFVLWTLANLLPRALTNHGWYRQKFPDYPGQRRAVIPFLL